MKLTFYLSFLCLSFNIAYAQSNPQHGNTQKFLNWLIKEDHIAYLNVKSDASAFYDTSALKKQTIVNASLQPVPKKCLQDLLSEEEVQIFKTVPHMLMQTDWTKKYSALHVNFVTDKFAIQREIKQIPFTLYSFSEPLFLNKDFTRVIIGEAFVCGMACGRGDLLLCEFKNGKWELIARAIVENE